LNLRRMSRAAILRSP